MALKVGGTEVVDNSRGLKNIATVDATTAASITAAGVGGGGSGTADLTASGAISDNDFVVLNTNGTVSTVAITKAASSDVDASSQVTINSDGGTQTGDLVAAFDPNNNNKILIAWRDFSGSSNRGRIVCGTISGETITFGSIVDYVPLSDAISIGDTSISFDPNTANQFIVAYRDGTNTNGKLKIGSLSGTTITLGSAQTVTSQNSIYLKVRFDLNTANKFSAAWRGTSNYAYAVSGTISSGTITLGSEATVESNTVYNINLEYDPNTADKYIVSYAHAGGFRGNVVEVSTLSLVVNLQQQFSNSSYDSKGIFKWNPSTANQIVAYYNNNQVSPTQAYARVVTVSGTTWSTGTEVKVHNSQVSDLFLDFDPNSATKCLFTFEDDRVGGSGATGFIAIGTISGTNLSVGNVFEHEPTNNVSDHIGLYDRNTANQFIMIYDESTNGRLAYKAAFTYTANLTQSNFLGFADGAAADTATATIKLRNNVYTTSGLTSGTVMYVQKDGTLSSSPDSVVGPVLGGTALTSTKLLLQNAKNVPKYDYNLLETTDLSGKNYYDIDLPVGKKVCIEMLGFQPDTTTDFRAYPITSGSTITNAMNFMKMRNQVGSGVGYYFGDSQGDMDGTTEASYFQTVESMSNSSGYDRFVGYLEIVDRQEFTISIGYKNNGNQTIGEYAKGFIIASCDAIRLQWGDASGKNFQKGKIRVRVI